MESWGRGQVVEARPRVSRLQRDYVDWKARGAEYRAGGWNRFDDAAGRYVPPAVMADDQLRRRSPRGTGKRGGIERRRPFVH